MADPRGVDLVPQARPGDRRDLGGGGRGEPRRDGRPQAPGARLPQPAPERFEPFFTTRHGGTGLGLATAQRVVLAHEGEISLESPPEGGTTVLIALPLA
ncbi:MAG: ATP-binding protein [Planctomycetota bacterium]